MSAPLGSFPDRSLQNTVCQVFTQYYHVHLFDNIKLEQIICKGRCGINSNRHFLRSPLTDKTKELITPAPKPVPPVVHSSIVPSHHPVPGLISGHSLYMEPNAIGPAVPASMIIQRASEEERWVARQRKLRQEKEDRQYQVSEFRQQVLEQHLDLGRPADTADHRTDPLRSVSAFHCSFP